MLSQLSFIAIVALFAMLLDTRSRLSRAEATLEEAAHRLGALQRQVASGSPAEAPSSSSGTPPTGPFPARVSPWSVPAYKAALPPAVAAQPKVPIEPASSTTPVELSASAPADLAPDKREAVPAIEAPAEPAATGFEDLFGRKLPIWAGGITLAIAGVLIVKYAIDAGLLGRIFTHGVQVVSGLLFGGGLISGAEFAWRNEVRVRDVRVPQALSGAGIASLYASVLVATNAYGLLAPLPAFVALAAITAGALGLSLRFGPPSAVLGLAGGLAAPALVGSMAPNVPMLAVYLGLTIAGLTGVARKQRWAWLAMAALLGGAGWSLFIILATGALNMAASLSLGSLVLLLAIALPTLAFDGPRSVLLRSASAVIGTVELAVLVANGGFTPLHWGLFALLALAGQWLAWRHADFTADAPDDFVGAIAIVPSMSLALSALLLAIWPHPDAVWFAAVSLSLATIHGLPLLVKLAGAPGRLRATLELCALAIAAPLLTRLQFMAISDQGLTLIALGSALLPGIAVARSWHARRREADPCFAVQSTTTGGMIALAMLLVLPAWLAPLGIALIAAGLFFFGRAAQDKLLEPIAFAFALATLPALVLTMPRPDEFACLVSGAGPLSAHAIIRWGGLSALFALFAARAHRQELHYAGQAVAVILGYGTLAQVLSANWLPLAPCLAGVALLYAAGRLGSSRTGWAIATCAGLSLAWAFEPLAQWAAAATPSLLGKPMTLEADLLNIAGVMRRLAIPALLFGSALWALKRNVPEIVRIAGLSVALMVAAVACHCLYRIGFAGVFGSDFAATGLGERVIWESLLIGGSWLAWRRGANALSLGLAMASALHTIWYTLLLHNPLWATQAVGPLPVLNLLIPSFALIPLGLAMILRLTPDRPAFADRVVQCARMVLIMLFAWANLRQAFHGTLLNVPGTFAVENILRSLLILALAIGFLLWGIRSRLHDWRIASLVLMLAAVGKVFLFDASGLEGLLRIGSFVALGFSLIGIGWLYSRQLAAAKCSDPA